MIFNLYALLRRFVTDFIDVFFRENARRAMSRDPPPDGEGGQREVDGDVGQAGGFPQEGWR